MNKVNTQLLDLIGQRRRELIEDLVNGLRQDGAPHYQQIDRDSLTTRSKELVAALEGAVSNSPDALVEHLRKIADQRIAEGFDLNEIQIALTLLESKMWFLCAQTTASREMLLGQLSLITSLIGHAKDVLACTYVEAWKQHQSAPRSLHYHLDELFKGTDAALMPQ